MAVTTEEEHFLIWVQQEMLPLEPVLGLVGNQIITSDYNTILTYVCTYVYVCACGALILHEYCIVEKCCGRILIFHDFALKQTFSSINFTICVLIVRACALILMILRIHFRKLDQIAKNAQY